MNVLDCTEDDRSHRQTGARQDQAIPIVDVKLIEGVFSPRQKRELIEKLTAAVIAVGGEHLRSVTWVDIEAISQGELAIGRKALTAADFRALQRGALVA